MSNLGWLAGESTLQRKSAKPIEGVAAGGVADLRAALYAKESELRSGTRVARTKFQPLTGGASDPLDRTGRPNSGLEARRARDEAAHARSTAAAGSDAQLEASRSHMQTKAALYDALVSGGVGAEGAEGAFLVDFEQKGLEHTEEQQAAAAASGPLHAQQLLERQPPAASLSTALSTSASSLSAGRSDPMSTQRADWERQALASLTSSATSAHSPHDVRAPRTDDEARRASRAQLEAAVSEEGQSARERIAQERRKRKAIVQSRRDSMHDQQARREQLRAARTLQERDELVRQLYQPQQQPQQQYQQPQQLALS